MRRKIIACLLIVVLLLPIPYSFASGVESTDTDKFMFDDGSYFVTALAVGDSGNGMVTFASGTAKGTRTVSYYDAAGTKQWAVSLTGTFSYNGSSATCTSATISVNIINSVWKISSQSAGKSGNKAIGDAVIIRKFLGVTIDTRTIHLGIVCDKDGNVS